MAATAAEPSGLSLPSFQGRQNLRDEVQQALRAAVVSGKMRPGVVYSAPALAGEFGVSATPVREAMLDLARGAWSSRCATRASGSPSPPSTIWTR